MANDLTDPTEVAPVDAVLASFARTPDPRLREILTRLVRHLHAFVVDIEPTMAEWQAAIDFLTSTGHACTDRRQEFILLSDVLGVSTLVESVNDRRPDPAPAAAAAGQDRTESTVLGPFHVVSSPPRALGDTIDLTGGGTPCLVTGEVRTTDGQPLPGATLDVWQADDQGFYDVQQPEEQPAGNGRGLFTADADGRFRFRSVVPRHYPIPTDGPVGDLLRATGRHANRPAHIHFIVAAEGHRSLTTQIYVADSPYIDSDAVFAVKRRLVREVETVHDPAAAARHGLPSPFRQLRFDFVLEPAEEAGA
ncbi:dioxygenase [Kitasatospora sp. GP82]|uniref:dioxygenase family protein n=1 Tax=Kitasatospora sp. GP82 TaxID=3035089 RepID=UPI002475BAD3|nr:dioxygenase [Kitasatospora sp. GP82]MDH6124066.1 hydroxyquinol 1,2-dioxygenase [Kitasatospora sp. GP82]